MEQFRACIDGLDLGQSMMCRVLDEPHHLSERRHLLLGTDALVAVSIGTVRERWEHHLCWAGNFLLWWKGEGVPHHVQDKACSPPAHGNLPEVLVVPVLADDPPCYLRRHHVDERGVRPGQVVIGALFPNMACVVPDVKCLTCAMHEPVFAEKDGMRWSVLPIVGCLQFGGMNTVLGDLLDCVDGPDPSTLLGWRFQGALGCPLVELRLLLWCCPGLAGSWFGNMFRGLWRVVVGNCDDPAE